MEARINIKKGIEEETVKALILLGVFVLLNSIKISVFNYMMMYSKGISILLYKSFYTLIIEIIVFSILLKIKWKFPIIIIYLGQAIYMFAYISYFCYFHSYLHLFQASALVTESVGPISHLSIPVNVNMLIILLDLPIFILFATKYRNLNRVFVRKAFLRKRILLSGVFILLIIEGVNFYNGISILQIGKNFYATEPTIVARYGTIVNNLSDIVFNYGGNSLMKAFKYGKTISAASSKNNKPNIIVIQVESMDANVIDKKYNGKYIAPFLHQLSNESIYYPYMMSYHKAGGTSDCEFSILNSIEPLSDFPSIKISKYNYPNSVVKVLKQGGYKALAFHGNIGAFYSRATAFKKMGFDNFYDINKMGFKNVGWGAPDGEVLNYALNKSKDEKQPFFSYIITMSSHMPFESVSNYYHNSNYDSINESKVKNYFNSISYVDKSIQDFVSRVREELPNTYVFIWGDHTPSINTDEYRQASYTSMDKYFEFVPMILLTPDKIIYKSSSKAATFLDIAPTILNASGIKFTYKSDGSDLLENNSKMSKIPFKLGYFTRTSLYNNVEEFTKY